MLHRTPFRCSLAVTAAVCLMSVCAMAQPVRSQQNPPAQHHTTPPSAQRPQSYRRLPTNQGQPVTGNTAHLPPPTNATQAPAPIVRRPVPPLAQVSANPHPPASQTGGETKAHPKSDKDNLYGKGEHLTDWMNAHGNLTPAQQQAALEREPGFRDLPAQTQQRIRGRLTELSTMTPDQRSKLLARNEQIEKLNPDQRAQVRGAMTQLSDLPADQRKVVAQSFRSLRGLPPEQRLAALNSDRYRNLNDQQRSTLQRLMQVEPILPKDETAPQHP